MYSRDGEGKAGRSNQWWQAHRDHAIRVRCAIIVLWKPATVQRASKYPTTRLPVYRYCGPGAHEARLILNAVNPSIGGVLIRGERGTAKSTAARALAALLPEIEVVVDCRFGCDPHYLERLCDECRERVARGEELPVKTRRTRLIDLPVSATEDRVVGTLDIEQAIQKGERHFDPGVLAQSRHLYVDEINLLDDHVVDLLLDSAAMGSTSSSAGSASSIRRASSSSTMNPKRRRPQLLDRFACQWTWPVCRKSNRMAILGGISPTQSPSGVSGCRARLS